MAGLLLDCCFSEKTESFEHSLALLRTYPRMHFNGLSFHTNRTVIVEMCAGFYTLGNSGFPAAAELPPPVLMFASTNHHPAHYLHTQHSKYLSMCHFLS